MIPAWDGATGPQPDLIGFRGWMRVVVRGVPAVIIVFGGFLILLALRLVERPVFGSKRPITPWLTVMVCRATLALMGLRCRRIGHPMTEPGAMVANHTSWLDIFTLNSGGPLYFVSKSEVSNWPGIGLLARGTGTVFIDRDRSQADAQTILFQHHLSDGHRLLFFPEGTSTDGNRVLDFKPTLFQAFFQGDLKNRMWVQPISVVYMPPPGKPPGYYAWWGDMGFASNLVSVLATWPQGYIVVEYHTPLPVSEWKNRKVLAAALHLIVADGHVKNQLKQSD
ncbi:MAG: 1-acyl-sn-glycerol-3-phosphate acyltransferase [Rhodobacteraceae bacterium]|nr:1-acyl-sn-glycerol-3-phosphate acyltransferase [Paracoccaceae bacterium]